MMSPEQATIHPSLPDPDNRILINGVYTSSINVLDRGLQYGDGLFETISVIDGKPLLWDRHMDRLLSGCARLSIPEINTRILATEVQQICSGQDRCVLKVIITRGAGGRGYRTPQANLHATGNMPTRILSIHPWPNYPETYSSHGITLRLCSTRLGINPALAGIKHLNRLEQVIARSEWNDPAIAEGLMLDSDGYVIEGTISNIFIVSGGTLLTPDLSGSGVDGVMRGLILDIARSLSIPVQITRLRVDDIKKADEILLCNTLIGLWPVRCFEDVDYHRSEVTQTIISELHKYLNP